MRVKDKSDKINFIKTSFYVIFHIVYTIQHVYK